ncbi:carboxypeptidase-like regulatory domain-containing protein [Uliginosibacterium flavum]|uniref:Carboxypeptidase-like regulatory domain-containing protein n=1 Tax=Uliginosibacterium flavum TaxID=1396831 RepID=A0ABV2TFM8_9RHOO
MHRNILLVLSGVLITHLALAAELPANLPAPTTRGAVTFVSGGIGLDESTAMKAAEKDYPLTLEFVVKTASTSGYTSDVKVLLADHNGKTLLDTVSNGPFLLVKLPPGNYRLEASKDGQTKLRQVDVRAGSHQKILIEWGT